MDNSLFKKLATIAVLTFLALAWAFAIAPDSRHEYIFFVAPGGDDGGSGSAEAPFATIERARDAVRALKAARDGTFDRPVRVIVADGLYRLRRTLTFTPLDSGTKEAPIVYEAAAGARPVFSGGRPITGFEPAGEKGLWSVHLPEVAEGDWYFEQLWVNGKRAIRARVPNAPRLLRPDLPSEAAASHTESYLYTYVPGKAQVIIDPETGEGVVGRAVGQAHEVRALRATPWDIAALADVPPHRLGDVTLVAYHSWETSRHRVDQIDIDAGVIFVKPGPASRPFNIWGRRQRYYLENFRAALDAPGEWFLDRDGTLYYMPLPDEDMAVAEVIAPAGPECLVEFAGDLESGSSVEHITLRGLSFRHGQYILPDSGHGDAQAVVSLPAAIMADGIRHVIIENCEVRHVGLHGIWFRHACHESAVRGTFLHDLGGGGMRIGMGWGKRHGDPSQIEFHNNIVHGGGRLFPGSIGVWIGNSGNNRITHNDISDLFYSGISVGWSWGYGGSAATNNTIEYNRIRHIGQGTLSDMGGVYTLGRSDGTTIRHNTIHDVYSYNWYGRGGWGLYADEGSSLIRMENNLVYNTSTGSFMQNHGKDNIIRNNIFVNSLDGQVERGGARGHNAFWFERNIVCWQDGSLYTRFTLRPMDRWVVSRSNLYWKAGGTPVRFHEHTLEDWQAKGMEHGSVIADPLFVDPVNNDFRLQPGSPAFDLGFEAFDFSQAGLVGEEQWTSRPDTFRYAERDLADRPPPLRVGDGFDRQDILARIARENKYPEYRLAAVNRLTDQATLASIALENPDLEIRYAAIRRLNDDDLRTRTVQAMEHEKIFRTDTSVMIDGDLSEWNGRPYIAIQAETPGRDLEARIHVAWDDQHLYLAAVVASDTHNNMREDDQIWDGDSFQFTVDPLRDDIEAFKFGLALVSGNVQAHQWRGTATGMLEAGEYKVVRDEEGGKTFYEIRIPFHRLRMEAREGAILGFNAVFFKDEDGTGYDYWIEITPGLAGGWDPAQFSKFILVAGDDNHEGSRK